VTVAHRSAARVERDRAPLPTRSPYTALFRSGVVARAAGGAHPGPHEDERGHGEDGDGEEDPAPADVLDDEPRDGGPDDRRDDPRSEEHTSELRSREKLVCRLLAEKKNTARLT